MGINPLKFSWITQLNLRTRWWITWSYFWSCWRFRSQKIKSWRRIRSQNRIPWIRNLKNLRFNRLCCWRHRCHQRFNHFLIKSLSIFRSFRSKPRSWNRRLQIINWRRHQWKRKKPLRICWKNPRPRRSHRCHRGSYRSFILIIWCPQFHLNQSLKKTLRKRIKSSRWIRNRYVKSLSRISYVLIIQRLSYRIKSIKLISRNQKQNRCFFSLIRRIRSLRISRLRNLSLRINRFHQLIRTLISWNQKRNRFNQRKNFWSRRLLINQN